MLFTSGIVLLRHRFRVEAQITVYVCVRSTLSVMRGTLLRLALLLLTATQCQFGAELITLPVASFPQLPRAIKTDLQQRRCRIPRSFDNPPRQNVLRADLNGDGKPIWAALCAVGAEALVLVYPSADSGAKALVLNRAPFDPPPTPAANPEYVRSLRTVDRSYVVRHNRESPAAGFPRNLVCLEDSYGMGSSLYCRLKGKWTTLRGAD